LQQRGMQCTDENGSDIFLELRCLYLLGFVKREVGEEAWCETRRRCPELLENVIRSNWSIDWNHVGDFDWLEMLMPIAFPKPADTGAMRRYPSGKAFIEAHDEEQSEGDSELNTPEFGDSEDSIGSAMATPRAQPIPFPEDEEDEEEEEESELEEDYDEEVEEVPRRVVSRRRE